MQVYLTKRIIGLAVIIHFLTIFACASLQPNRTGGVEFKVEQVDLINYQVDANLKETLRLSIRAMVIFSDGTEREINWELKGKEGDLIQDTAKFKSEDGSNYTSLIRFPISKITPRISLTIYSAGIRYYNGAIGP